MHNIYDIFTMQMRTERKGKSCTNARGAKTGSMSTETVGKVSANHFFVRRNEMHKHYSGLGG